MSQNCKLRGNLQSFFFFLPVVGWELQVAILVVDHNPDLFYVSTYMKDVLNLSLTNLDIAKASCKICLFLAAAEKICQAMVFFWKEWDTSCR